MTAVTEQELAESHSVVKQLEDLYEFCDSFGTIKYATTKD